MSQATIMAMIAAFAGTVIVSPTASDYRIPIAMGIAAIFTLFLRETIHWLIND